MPRFIRPFRELSIDDIALVGGKNASLGEMVRELSALGVLVPDGFAITVDAYRALLGTDETEAKLRETLAGLDPEDVADLARRGQAARDLLLGVPMPEAVESEIAEAANALRDEYGPDLTFAVRSSATAEDLPTASFAGQQDTFLNVRGDAALLDACRRCFASLFTDRAIHYRIDHGFDHFDVALSIGVQKMVRADLAASGVMFTIDTETGFPDVVLISGAFGLGENVVQGAVDPDEFYVHKPTFEAGHRAVLRRLRGEKQVRMVFAEGRTRGGTMNIPVPAAERERYCLTDEDVLALAEQAIAVERHYSARAGHPIPMDLEWAQDGLDGRLYIVQARPETVAVRRSTAVHETFRIKSGGRVRVTGRAVGDRIATGPVRRIDKPADLTAFRAGEVLVAHATTPDSEPVLKNAAAVVTDTGGRTCHAAIVARELGIPAVVGTTDATTRLCDGEVVTVSCAEGEIGKVYDGEVPFATICTDLADLPSTRTEILVNIANPDAAFRVARFPVDGVGLARLEFIINDHIGVHPMALVHPDRVSDPAEREEIERLVRGYESGGDFFVERLAEGVGTIAAAFYPRPVVVRLSDFKTNEYAALLGGAAFEPDEENPMIGFRGAARYAHPAYADGFALECRAMRRVRETLGLTNVKLMIPFCRRVEEAKQVLETMAEHGLARGKNGLEIYVMCEIPNNVILIDRFAELFDGFSIGSNDLTQLTLGVDRDSELVAFDFDDRDEGVLEMIRLAIEGAHRNGRHVGICGQAPSDYPEVAEQLVRLGIDSMSLNPDSVVEVRQRVASLEELLGR